MDNKQRIANYIDKLLSNNTIGHAYLLEVDDLYSTDLAIELVKKIIARDIFDTNQLQVISEQINSNVFPDLKIIRPDGKQIKKEQIFNLLAEYKNKSVNNIKRFYIIEYAEDLNPAAGNSILKFLEEPENDIVAILITKNLYNVLETIVSRCQILNLNNFLSNEFDQNIIVKSFEYLQLYEDRGEKAVAYLSELYLLKTEDLKNVFKIWSKIYEDALIFKINGVAKSFINNKKQVEDISIKNSKKKLINKINNLDMLITLFNSNINNRVMLDKFFLGGDQNESC